MKTKITNLSRAASALKNKASNVGVALKAKVTRAKATKVSDSKVTDIVPKVTNKKSKSLDFLNTLGIVTTAAQPYIFILINHEIIWL